MSKLSDFLEKNIEYHNISFTITEEYIGLRADIAIVMEDPDISRSTLKSSDCVIMINNHESKLSYKLKLGDKLSAYWKKIHEINFEAEKVPFTIIYKDDDLMIIDKPWGIVVHPAKGHESGTLANGILHYLQEENINDDFGEEGRVGIVHRLDKDTRGLMLIALNEKTLRALSEDFKNRQITKIYKAIVKGHTPEHGIIENQIGRSKYDRKKMAVVKTGGRDARTDYKVLEYLKDHTLIACKLFTGRTHQIRIHLLNLGYPIVNDILYSRQRVHLLGMGLIACHLAFIHPSTKKEMAFTLPDPPAFTELISNLSIKKEKDT